MMTTFQMVSRKPIFSMLPIYDRIERKSECSWLDKLLTAVFISHTKVLSSVGNNKRKMEDSAAKKASQA